jgi:hypothetical protein
MDPQKGKNFETACFEELSGGLLAKVWFGKTWGWIRIGSVYRKAWTFVQQNDYIIWIRIPNNGICIGK